MADHDQQKEPHAKPLDRDEAVEDLEVRDEAADEVKGGAGSISFNYTSVEQTYKGQ
jgi:hypothetical protein